MKSFFTISLLNIFLITNAYSFCANNYREAKASPEEVHEFVYNKINQYRFSQYINFDEDVDSKSCDIVVSNLKEDNSFDVTVTVNEDNSSKRTTITIDDELDLIVSCKANIAEGKGTIHTASFDYSFLGKNILMIFDQDVRVRLNNFECF